MDIRQSFSPVLEKFVELHYRESFTPGFKRIKLYPGDVAETLSRLKKSEGERISLLVLDMDL